MDGMDGLDGMVIIDCKYSKSTFGANKEPNKFKCLQSVPANYRLWVLRSASRAMSSLPPPREGTLRQVAQAALERQDADKAVSSC